MAENGEPVLDLDTIQQLLDLDDGAYGLLREMLTLYQEDTPDRILAMEHTLASGEMTDLADFAHAVKGAAGTMGAPKVRAIAADMEAGGRLGTWKADAGLLLEQLKEAFEESRQALQDYLDQNDPEPQG